MSSDWAEPPAQTPVIATHDLTRQVGPPVGFGKIVRAM
jgi:hypothetical protein